MDHHNTSSSNGHTEEKGRGEGACPPNLEETKASLEKIRCHLVSSGQFLLQGPLLKRSDTLRKWNQRWFTLDPTIGNMEYRLQRGDLSPKGIIYFDSNSTITASSINFLGLDKYDGCCIYIETHQKNKYFLCAETAGAAQAWVSTLRATQLVLKSHEEAANSVSGNEAAQLGTVAAAVAGANATARESLKDIGAAMQISVNSTFNSKYLKESDGLIDEFAVIKETLNVKDEALHEMASKIRAKDSTIREMAERLTETVKAAEAAASAAHIMDKERKASRAEIAQLRMEFDDKLKSAKLELRTTLEKLAAAEKACEEALQEARTWQVELKKAREHEVAMETNVLIMQESARITASEAEAKIKVSLEKKALSNARAAKDKPLREVERLEEQVGSSGTLTGAVPDGSCVQDLESSVEKNEDMEESNNDLKQVCASDLTEKNFIASHDNQFSGSSLQAVDDVRDGSGTLIGAVPNGSCVQDLESSVEKNEDMEESDNDLKQVCASDSTEENFIASHDNQFSGSSLQAVDDVRDG